jgi:hypothetical protein
MPSPTIISYSLVDENGDAGSVSIFVAYDAATETASSLLGAAAAFGGKIDAITGCVITGFGVNIGALPDPSWKTAPVADTDVQKGLLLNFNAADTVYPQEILIPGLLGSLVGANGQPILTSGAAIDQFADLIVSGSGAVYPNNKFLLDLTSLRDAAVSFRKRKGSLAKSRVKA